MTTTCQTDEPSFGVLASPSTLVLKRTLPGPVERVWSYLIDSDLRQQWLAAGPLNPQPGASFELVWRNDELSEPGDERPEGFGAEHRATCRVTEVETLRKLGYHWPGVGDVTFELEPVGSEVVLTVTHRHLANRHSTLMVGAGWHTHCDILVARMNRQKPGSYWTDWVRLRDEYDRRIPA